MILRARGWLPRFGRTKVDPYEGSGKKAGNGGGGSVETGGAVEVSGPRQERDICPFFGRGGPGVKSGIRYGKATGVRQKFERLKKTTV